MRRCSSRRTDSPNSSAQLVHQVIACVLRTYRPIPQHMLQGRRHKEWAIDMHAMTPAIGLGVAFAVSQLKRRPWRVHYVVWRSLGAGSAHADCMKHFKMVREMPQVQCVQQPRQSHGHCQAEPTKAAQRWSLRRICSISHNVYYVHSIRPSACPSSTSAPMSRTSPEPHLDRSNHRTRLYEQPKPMISAQLCSSSSSSSSAALQHKPASTRTHATHESGTSCQTKVEF